MTGVAGQTGQELPDQEYRRTSCTMGHPLTKVEQAAPQFGHGLAPGEGAESRQSLVLEDHRQYGHGIILSSG